jgi:hypothetical protein
MFGTESRMSSCGLFCEDVIDEWEFRHAQNGSQHFMADLIL